MCNIVLDACRVCVSGVDEYWFGAALQLLLISDGDKDNGAFVYRCALARLLLLS